jgi:hypothetical protein
VHASLLDTPGPQALEQMVADPQRIGDDRQGRVDSGARHEKAAVDDVEVVDLVRAAVDVECRALRVAAEADRAILVARAGNRQALSEIGILRQQMRRTAYMVEQMPQLCVSRSCGLRLLGV